VNVADRCGACQIVKIVAFPFRSATVASVVGGTFTGKRLVAPARESVKRFLHPLSEEKQSTISGFPPLNLFLLRGALVMLQQTTEALAIDVWGFKASTNGDLADWRYCLLCK
jgi:hypothetical protein